MPKFYDQDQVLEAMGGGNITEDESAVIIENSQLEVIAQRSPDDPDQLEIIDVNFDDGDDLKAFWSELGKVDKINDQIKKRFGDR